MKEHSCAMQTFLAATASFHGLSVGFRQLLGSSTFHLFCIEVHELILCFVHAYNIDVQWSSRSSEQPQTIGVTDKAQVKTLTSSY
mmetsp:Transcript_19502/g.33510  ORF Transcript_19502/g.33510 Transcript_19502/m.33510 type:complete len:85 (+) Transcript_19502:421-675(+)